MAPTINKMDHQWDFGLMRLNFEQFSDYRVKHILLNIENCQKFENSTKPKDVKEGLSNLSHCETFEIKIINFNDKNSMLIT